MRNYLLFSEVSLVTDIERIFPLHNWILAQYNVERDQTLRIFLAPIFKGGRPKQFDFFRRHVPYQVGKGGWGGRPSSR